MGIFRGYLKGWFGELKTTFSMWLSLDNQIYRRFHNIIIPSTNGTTQIDHILVSSYGVFIVETKNKDGWIFGSEDQAEWTQVLYFEKYKFQNPLRQTYRQRRILAQFIGIDENYINQIVYFVGDCEFKTQLPSNVLNIGLVKYIKNFQEHVISQEKINRIINILEQHILEKNFSNYDHVLSLAERHNSKIRCPRCGADLILRTARTGANSGSEFLGCMNYPRCRFTRNNY